MKNYYYVNKAQYKQEAIKWQVESGNKFYSYSELAVMYDYFYKVGKKYGLVKEFKENGIL